MTQRIALIIAGAMMTFVLLLVAGVAASVAVKSLAPVQVDVRSEVQAQAVAAPTQVPAPSAPAQVSAPLAPSPTPIKVKFTANQAAQIALRSAERSTLVRTPELVNLSGTVAYEVLFNQGVAYVDANSGKILSTVAKPSATPNRSSGRRQENEQGENEHD
jgi:hypothetical protein